MKPTRLLILLTSLCCFFALNASVHAADPVPPAKTGDTPPAKSSTEPAPKPEARREDVEPKTLTEAKTELETVRGERKKAEDAAAAAQASLDTRTSELTEANRLLTEANGKLSDANLATTAAKDRHTKLAAAIQKALGLTDEQVNNIDSDPAIITGAIDHLANQKAITIAAGQGVPPVVTKPGASADDDEVKQAYAAAQAETDPRKRGALFAAATALLNKKAAGKN